MTVFTYLQALLFEVHLQFTTLYGLLALLPNLQYNPFVILFSRISNLNPASARSLLSTCYVSFPFRQAILILDG